MAEALSMEIFLTEAMSMASSLFLGISGAYDNYK